MSLGRLEGADPRELEAELAHPHTKKAKATHPVREPVGMDIEVEAADDFRLAGHEVLIRRPEIRDRVEVIYARSVQKSGEIDGMLGGVYRDLHDPVRNDGNRRFTVTSLPPQPALDWTPRALIPAELDPFALEVLGEHVNGGRLVPAGAEALSATN